MRIRRELIAISAVLMLASCTDPQDDTPLRGSQGGLSSLRWGDGPDEVRCRMLEMPGVVLIRDTVEIHAFAAWMSPDTVQVPYDIRRYRMMEFRGGKFLGYPVEWWLVTLDDATSFRQVRVGLVSVEDAGELQWRVRRQLQRLYQKPNEPDLEPNRFLSDDWATPAESASSAPMAVGIGRNGSDIIVEFVDRAWEAQRWPSRNDRQRRRMHADDWRRYLTALAKERGWRLEDLPPQ